MKTRYIAFCTALMMSLVAAPALFAQYPGQVEAGIDQAMCGTNQTIAPGQIGYTPLMQAEPIGEFPGLGIACHFGRLQNRLPVGRHFDFILGKTVGSGRCHDQGKN